MAFNTLVLETVNRAKAYKARVENGLALQELILTA